MCIHSVVTPSFIPRLLPGRAGGSSPHSDTTEGQTIDYPGNLREKAVQGQTQESSVGRQGTSGYRRAGPMGSSLPSGPEKRGAHAGAGPTRPKVTRRSKKPRLKGSEVRDRAPLCAGHLHPGDPVLQAWGRSLSPHDRFSDLSYVPATPAPLILQKRGKNGPRQASSRQKPDAFGVSFSKNRCWAESLIGVMDGVRAPRTSPCDSAARATGHSVLR